MSTEMYLLFVVVNHVVGDVQPLHASRVGELGGGQDVALVLGLLVTLGPLSPWCPTFEEPFIIWATFN